MVTKQIKIGCSLKSLFRIYLGPKWIIMNSSQIMAIIYFVWKKCIKVKNKSATIGQKQIKMYFGQKITEKLFEAKMGQNLFWLNVNQNLFG